MRTSVQRILIKGRIAYRAVIKDWMIHFSAYTATETTTALHWAGQPKKLSLPVGS